MSRQEAPRRQPTGEDKVISTRNPESAFAVDVLSYADYTLSHAAVTDIDAQIISQSREQLRIVKRLLAGFVKPLEGSGRIPLSAHEAMLRILKEPERSVTTYSVIQDAHGSLEARISLIHARRVNNEDLPTKPTAKCIENILHGMGALAESEQYQDLIREYNQDAEQQQQDPECWLSEMQVFTLFPTAKVLINPYFGRVDLLLSERGVEASLHVLAKK